MKIKNLFKVFPAMLVSFLCIMMGALGAVTLFIICFEKSIELGWLNIDIVLAKRISFLPGVIFGASLNGYLCLHWIKSWRIEGMCGNPDR